MMKNSSKNQHNVVAVEEGPEEQIGDMLDEPVLIDEEAINASGYLGLASATTVLDLTEPSP